MRILVAGASGVIGARLLRLLVGAGHVVAGTTRTPAKAAAIRAAGARPLVVNVFDGQELGDTVAAVHPEVVVHQLTDLPDRFEPAGLSDALARNARIRAEGTRNLVAAAVRAGARRLVAQSIAWVYAPGPEPHREEDPLDVSAEGDRGVTVRGVVALERLVMSVPRLDGVVLRYGRFYGPGTASAAPSGGPSVHVEAAARAAALAVALGMPGVYNIVDDSGNTSNAKARTELGWDPELR